MGLRLLLCVLCGISASAQSPAILDGEALKLLTAVDARLVRPLDAKAFSFSFHPLLERAGEGPRQAEWSVRYSWRDKLGDRVDFFDAADKLLAQVPDAPEAQREEAARQHLLMARGMAEIFRGRTLVQTYQGCRGRVERNKVNGIDEVSLILEPAERVRVARTVLHLDKRGVPWKIDRTLVNGDAVRQHPQYELHGERFALDALQHIETPAVSSVQGRSYAYRFTWQSVDGHTVPASIAKQSRNPKEPGLGTTAFFGVRLDAQVPEFEPQSPRSGH